MGFSSENAAVGCCSLPGNLPRRWVEPESLTPPALAAGWGGAGGVAGTPYHSCHQGNSLNAFLTEQPPCQGTVPA